MVASPTLREALLHVTRYYGLLVRHAQWVLQPRGEDGLTLLEHVAKVPVGTMPAQLRELSVANIIARIRAWSGRPPLEAWLSHAPFGPAEEYRRVLGCETRFNQPRSGVLFDDTLLDAPGARSDPKLESLLQAHADVLLARAPADASLAQQVRGAIIAELRAGEPDVERIARRLATSARSLQRRLQEEGTSFRAVVDATRLELAELYLGDDNLSIADVSYLLGYSEAPAFIRAFKRWTGRTPSAGGRRK
jgi:AraC-like DNA-binding protein